MRASESIGSLIKALSVAQGEFTNPERNRTVKVATKGGGSYTFDYTTFDHVVAMARPVLARHGLAVIQGVNTSIERVEADGHVVPCVTVTTRVAHESGEWIEDEIKGNAEGTDLQDIGSAVTYLKRYSYTAMLGIAAEEDDDGGAGSGRPTEAVDRPKMPPCPECGSNRAVIIGRPEYGGGFLCFAKKDGCGHKWNPESKEPEAPPPVNGKKEVDPASKLYAAALQKIMQAKSNDELDELELKVIKRANDEDITREHEEKLLRTVKQQRNEIARKAEAMAKSQA